MLKIFKSRIKIAILIYKKKLIRVGKNVIIKNVVFEGRNSIDHFSILEGGKITLGIGSTISSHCVLRGPISIGRYTQLGPGVKIFSKDHAFNHLSNYAGSALFNGELKNNQTIAKIMIGSDVWIGANVVILKGVEIGHGAVIAAGSVVVKNVPPYSIYAGVPAKKLKDRFEAELKSDLLANKWWEEDILQLEKMKNRFFEKLM